MVDKICNYKDVAACVAVSFVELVRITFEIVDFYAHTVWVICTVHLIFEHTELRGKRRGKQTKTCG